MKTLMALCACFCLVAFSTVAQADSPKTFVVLTSPNPEVQGMAMILSRQALKNGSEVRLLLCDQGGDLALKSHQSPTLKPMDKSPQQMMKGLIKQGVTVEVCGLYLPNRSVSSADLVKGVKGVKPPVIGQYMADPTVRYFTF